MPINQHLIHSRSFVYSLLRQMIFFLCLIPFEATANNKTETVTLQLKWHHQFQFAGYYAALEKGFYLDAGLDVKIQPHGTGLKSPVDQVLSDAAQYGVADTGIVKDRLAGKPVVVLANIFQKSPLCWIVREDSEIRSPHDFIGKRVMYLPGQHSELLAMLQVEGIPASKINLIASSFDIQDLINGHTDAFNAYSTNEPYILREQGIAYRLITPRNYGIDSYGDVLFTSQSEIDEHPERVKAFRLASLKGWKYAMDHPDEIADLISNRYASNKSLPHLKFEAEAMRELFLPDLVTIGHINPDRWRVIAEQLVSLGLIEGNYDLLEGFIYNPYPKPQNLRQLYVVTVLVALLALLFLGLVIWIWRLNICFKKSEDEIRAQRDFMGSVLDVASNIIVVLDLKGNFVRFNHAAELLTGYRSEEVIGHPIWELVIPGEQIEAISGVFDNLLKGNIEIAGQYDNEWISRDGERKLLHWHNTVLRDDEGHISHIVSLGYDITLQKENEAKQFRLQQELQQAQKMEALGKLTGGIAHDYNNMLGIVIGFAELLEGALSDQPKLARYAHEIHYAGQRGATLTKKLLSFSRRKTPEANKIDLNMLLQNQQHMLEKTLTVRINLELKLQENLWLVWLDDGDMEDAILNMSINAMHAIENNGRLIIQTSNQKINQLDAQSLGLISGDYVLLSVTDTGCGMDDEIREKIFDPFYSTKGEQGSGLGLSQVYGFVQSSAGVIKVYSESGQDTRFLLYFPRYYDSSHDKQPTENHLVTAFKGNETILLVDDEPGLLNLSREILEPHGFNIICAERAKQALNILEHESIDIMISDVIMPEMDGYQLSAIVKEKYPAIKIQLVSGFTDVQNMSMVDEGLQQNLLLKPFNAQALLQRVRELLNEK
jgi:two-component system, cell cycle sensor histidine kinase and response regulator CckA